MQQVNISFHVPLPATFIRFQYERSLVMNVCSCIFSLAAIFYNVMLSRNVILCIYRALYVGHIIYHRQSVALSIA